MRPFARRRPLAGGEVRAKYFSAHRYETLKWLCDTIIPKDDRSGGAVEAGAPESSTCLPARKRSSRVVGGGLMWLANFCLDRYGKIFLESTPEQRKEVLDLIAYRKNARRTASEPGSRLLCVSTQNDLRWFLYSKMGSPTCNTLGTLRYTSSPVARRYRKAEEGVRSRGWKSVTERSVGLGWLCGWG